MNLASKYSDMKHSGIEHAEGLSLRAKLTPKTYSRSPRASRC